MPKYIKNNLTEQEARNQNTRMDLLKEGSDNAQSAGKRFFDRFIFSFILGENQFEENEFRWNYFTDLPKRESDPLKNMENIIEYLMEYVDEIDKKDKGDYNERTSRYEKTENNRYLFRLNNNLRTDRVMMNSAVAGTPYQDAFDALRAQKNPKENNYDAEMYLNSTQEMGDKYELYQAYANMRLAQKMRKPRKFFDIVGYFQRKKEEKTLNQIKEKLVSLGVKPEFLNRVETKYQIASQHDFEQNLVTNAHDRVLKYHNGIRHIEKEMDLYKPFKESTYLKRLAIVRDKFMPYVKGMQLAHDAERNNERNSIEKVEYENEARMIRSYISLCEQRFGLSRVDVENIYNDRSTSVERIFDKPSNQINTVLDTEKEIRWDDNIATLKAEIQKQREQQYIDDGEAIEISEVDEDELIGNANREAFINARGKDAEKDFDEINLDNSLA